MLDNNMPNPFSEFDATLTQAEKSAPAYLDWSDETIARAVREIARAIHDYGGQDGMGIIAAFNVIAGAAKARGAMSMSATSGEYTLDVRKVTEKEAT